MQYNDPTLIRIDGFNIANGADISFDVEDFMYILKTEVYQTTGPTKVFKVFAKPVAGNNTVRQLDYRADGRSVSDFLALINATAPGQPLKLYSTFDGYDSRSLSVRSILFKADVIINDNYVRKAYVQDEKTFVDVTDGITPEVTTLSFLGNQLGSADTVYAVLEDITENIAAQGTTDATTTVLNYGVNIVSTVTLADYAVKLPQPKTGRISRIINNSDTVLYVFPSNPGGQINQLPVDTPARIPADGKIYDFICIENPLPGAWTYSPPATAQLELNEMVVSHTTGADTNRYGVGGALTPTAGAGTDAQNNITLSGNWTTIAAPATRTRLKVYTNIIATDDLVPSSATADNIIVTLLTAWKTDVSSVTFGQRETLRFMNDAGYQGETAPAGTLNAPPEVGDTGTMYFIFDTIANVPAIINQIGQGGAFSSYYFTIGMFIPDTAATKDYKFKVFVEYF